MSSEDATQDREETGAAPITPDRLRLVNQWIDEGELAPLRGLVEALHEADLADLIEQIDPGHRRLLIEQAAPHMNAEVFVHIRPEVRRELIALLKPRAVAAIVADLDSDDAVDMVLDLEQQQREKIFQHLSRRIRADIEQGLEYPEDSAGRLIQRELIAFPQFWTVGKTIDYLRGGPVSLPDDFYNVFIVDPMYRVAGVVPAARVLKSHRGVRLIDIAETEVRTIPVEMDQEDVAHLFRTYGLYAAPVVTGDNRLLGVITVDDVVDVIEEEAEEDILALGGVSASDFYRDALTTTRSRFSWLALNLLTAIMASVVIGLFEATIEQVVALAVLMPIVASMGGNAGTQTLTVAVRALATRELTGANAFRLLGKELVVGALNGVLFALLAGVIAALWFGNPTLGMVIAVAMVVNLVVAGVAGAGIPILLNRFGIDPAVASAVFLTTVTDVIGFFAFLGLAALVLL